MTKKVEILEQNGYHFLWIDGELWMWDLPEEIKQQKEIAAKAFGNVLVAGYGLGIVQKFMLENHAVEGILTAEINPEVLEACLTAFPDSGHPHGSVVYRDFYEFSEDDKFDCVIGDAWLEISPVCLPEYIKFKEKAKRMLRDGGRILAWGQEAFDVWESRG